MTKPFPDFTLYVKIGIEGLESEEIAESVVFAWNEDLSPDQNAVVLAANAQLTQVRQQVALMKLMKETLPKHLEEKAREEGLDFDPNFFTGE
jgi:hypothetical protein